MNPVDILLLTVVGEICLLGYTFFHRRNPATVLLRLMLVTAAVWAITYYLELTLPSLDAKIAVHLARFTAVPWLLVLWLAMVRHLLGVGHGLPRWCWVIIIATAAITTVLAATARWHQWFQYDFSVYPVGATGGLGILRFQSGPWFLIYEVITIAALAPLVFGLLLRAWPGASPIMRRQLLSHMIQLGLPIGATTLYALGWSPLPHVNLAPFLLFISLAALAWDVLVYRALDIVPVARGVLLDTMRDMVFVLDAGGRLVDLNLAAVNALGRGLVDWLGKTPAELPPPWRAAVESTEPLVAIETACNRRWFERTSQSLATRRQQSGGTLVTLRDVTDEVARQQRELAFQKLHDERRHLRQQELLIRDLHDGVGGIVAAIGMLSALGLKEPDPAAKDTALLKILDLAGEGNVEVRTLMGTLDSREFLWADLFTEIRRHGSMVEANHGIAFTLKVTGEGDAEGPGLFAGMALFRIFKEAMNNVVKHAAASRIDIRLVFQTERLLLTIADDGGGIAATPGSGRGLRHMRQRITELGGAMRIDGARGTTLEFTAAIPLKSPDEGMDSPPFP